MNRTRVHLASAVLVCAALAGGASSLVAKEKQQKSGYSDQQVLRALDRFTFGPRPGDMDRVRAMGLEKWFDQQLHPDSISDAAAEEKVAGFRTLKMSSRDILLNYPSPQILEQVIKGNLPMPNDPERHAIYQTAIERYQARKQNKQEQPQNIDGMLQNATTVDNSAVAQEKKRKIKITDEDREAAHADVGGFMTKSPDQRYRMILAMEDGERVALLRQLKPEERQQAFAEFTPQQRETIIALSGNPAAVPTTELLQAKIFREVYSDRQLEEVMTDFWLNHFNVFINKGQQERYLLASYERDAIRPHALGKFKDLLMATAHSPAMLFYLDQSESIGPDSEFAVYGGKRPQPRVRRGRFGQLQVRYPQQRAQNKKKASGLNENYAREVMELHTLGVDGGYTQQDVTQLAKILTGWTITPPRKGEVKFEYRAEWHEPGDKQFLGKRFHDDGEKEGEKALEMLAHSPATAHFISKKLAMRFVSDDPPPELVDRMAKTFTKSDGDIRQVLLTMFHSPEMWQDGAQMEKVKTPLEFVVSALRATSADIFNAQPIAAALNKMGMPLYGMQPPTGYSMKADAWFNSAALLNRLNFALGLATGRVPGVVVDPQTFSAASDADLAHMEAALLGAPLSAQTHGTIETELDDPSLPQRVRSVDAGASMSAEEALATAGQMRPKQTFRFTAGQPPTRTTLAMGLVLGSPEFQKR